MADSDRTARLRAIPLFADLEDTALRRVAAIATELELPEGRVLIERDQPGSGMFVIEEGAVTVELPAQTLELGPGEFVGELSLLVDGATRAARVQTARPTRCLAISRVDFAQLLEDDPKIGAAMLPVLARRLIGMIEAR